MEVLYKVCNRRWEFLLNKTLEAASMTLGDTAHLQTQHTLRTELSKSIRVELTCSNVAPDVDVIRHTDTKLSSIRISIC